MKCFQCGNSKTQRIKRDHKFVECGLASVTITDCTFIVCNACGEEMLGIANPSAVLRGIARQLIFKPAPLTPPEVRFLRDHVDWSNKAVAKFMNVTEEQSSRWATGNGTGRSMGASAEELFRLMVFMECMTTGEHADAIDQLKALMARPSKMKPKRSAKVKAPLPLKIKIAA